MNQEQVIKLVDSINEKRRRLLQKRNQDYAEDNDFFKNFREVWSICEVLDINTSNSMEDCALFMVVMKLQRYCNLRGRDPEGEVVEDTVVDFHNYLDIAYLISDLVWFSGTAREEGKEVE